MPAFADDNCMIKWHKDLSIAKAMLETSIWTISNWLRDSGLMVNDSVTWNGEENSTKAQINVLGTIFDSKLNYSGHLN